MKPKVLAIDDEPDILEAISIILKTNGYDVVTHTTIPSIKWLLKINPKIVLLDLILKRKNGAKICAMIKTHTSSKHIPVILLSANPLATLKSASKDCQADAYIPKPFDMTHLLQTVGTALPSH